MYATIKNSPPETSSKRSNSSTTIVAHHFKVTNYKLTNQSYFHASKQTLIQL